MLIQLLSSLLVPVAFALNYNTVTLPYTDIPSDLETQVALSALTELGIVEGNPDGSFRADTELNRAEFMKIALGFLNIQQESIATTCFPDIDPDAWYAYYVCLAKELNIVSGNELPGLPPSAWPFEPTRSVQYEEAVKILVQIFGVPLVDSHSDLEWYEKYTATAIAEGIDLWDAKPGSRLTRGQMARLSASFYAWSQQELDLFRAAQAGEVSSSVSSVSSTISSSSVSSVSSSSSRSVTYDPLLNDTSTDGGLLILGTTTKILASASVFPDAEPLRVDEFLIDLVTANTSLDSLLVYDHDGVFIGRATLDSSFVGNTRYKLRTSNLDIVIPKRESYSFYVRGVLKAEDRGGVSGGSIQIDDMGVVGTGDWSNRDYQQWTDDTFAASQVGRSSIIQVSNAGDSSSVLVPGDNLEIGAFYFAGQTGHSSADVKITAIDFTLGITGGVTVSSPFLKADGGSETHNCSVGGSTVTCSALPDSFGEIDNGSRTLRLFGDVVVPDSSQNARLQVSINAPGSPSSAGDITWTDGTTTFTWVDSGTTPVARGTSYSY